MALLDGFRAAFDALPAALREAGGLLDVRRAALEAALSDGLPAPRSEAWKYTSLRALERRSFAPAVPGPVDPAVIADIPAPRLVFVDGAYDAGLSDLAGLPDGVTLEPLSQALRQATHPRDVNLLAYRFDGRDAFFARLNAALAVDGALLRAGPGVASAVPVHLVQLSSGRADGTAAHLRQLIELHDDARLIVVEHLRAATPAAALVNTVSHVHVKRGAQLRHARVQTAASGGTQVLHTEAVLAGDAVYRRVDLELGAALSRHALNVSLQGRGAQLAANGVLLADGRRHLDTRLGVDHAAPGTGCDLRWRGLGAGRGRVVFHGGILIRAGADGTAASLSNKNLLLSEGAEIDAQPVLEIHADEVQAAHGATVGQLDRTSLFYLRSRGIPEAEARALLVAAFCRETLAVLDDERLPALLEAPLARALEALETA